MGFLEKTLRGISGYITDALYSERYASEKGFLQAVHPGVKLISILALIFLSSLIHSLGMFLFLMSVALILAASSRISLPYYVMRVWLFVPLFTAFIAIPAMFEAVTPGEVIFSWSILGMDMNITREGLLAAVTLVLRVATTISFAILLTLTTRWEVLMRSLRHLGVPPVFIMVMTSTYRYIFHLFTLMENMILSRKARSGIRQSATRNWRMYAPLIGALFIKAYDTNERVHMAMKARGFGGDIRHERGKSPGTASFLMLIFVALIYVLVIAGEMRLL